MFCFFFELVFSFSFIIRWGFEKSAIIIIIIIHWAGHVSRMKDHHLPNKLFTGHYNRRGTKKMIQRLFEKNLLLTITGSPPKLKIMTPGISPSTMLSISLKTSVESPSRTKGAGGKTTTLHHQTLTRPSDATAAAMPAYPVLSAISMPTVNIDYPLLNLHSQIQAMMMIIKEAIQESIKALSSINTDNPNKQYIVAYRNVCVYIYIYIYMYIVVKYHQIRIIHENKLYHFQ